MMKIKKGYTLLEILVVMAIIAFLLAMLIQVMANFRRTIELQQASDLIVSSVNETKNYAANNVLPDGLVIDNNSIYAYRLFPQSNDIERRVCQKIGNSLTWDCSISTKIDKFVDVQNNNIVLNTVGCDSILLINLISDWQVGSSGVYSDSVCQIELSHRTNSQIFRKFIFNGAKNTFEIEYGN